MLSTIVREALLIRQTKLDIFLKLSVIYILVFFVNGRTKRQPVKAQGEREKSKKEKTRKRQ